MPRRAGGGVWGGSLSLIGQKFTMVDGKQSSDWTIIQDDNSVCDWTRIQDGEWKIQILFDVGQLLWCIVTINSNAIYYPFEVLIAFNKKAIKLQSVINYITFHCHNTSKGIRIKILVTSSGNIRNQLVYVANQNKTFERNVQVLSFIWETPMLFSIRLQLDPPNPIYVGLIIAKMAALYKKCEM